jgi:hypothetical protein
MPLVRRMLPQRFFLNTRIFGQGFAPSTALATRVGDKRLPAASRVLFDDRDLVERKPTGSARQFRKVAAAPGVPSP